MSHIQRVRELPPVAVPGVLYFLRPDGQHAAQQFLGSASGAFVPVSSPPVRHRQNFGISGTWVVNHNLGARPAVNAKVLRGSFIRHQVIV